MEMTWRLYRVTAKRRGNRPLPLLDMLPPRNGDLQKSVQTLADKHKISMNSKKRIVNDDLRLQCKVVQEKLILTINAC